MHDSPRSASCCVREPMEGSASPSPPGPRLGWADDAAATLDEGAEKLLAQLRHRAMGGEAMASLLAPSRSAPPTHTHTPVGGSIALGRDQA